MLMITPFKGRTRLSRRCDRSAFTLLELLVVIGIIALLMALLFPAFAKIHRDAQRVLDLANIRSFGQSCLSYAANNDGVLPLGQRENASATGNDDLVWMRYSTCTTLMKTYGLTKQGLACNAEWDAGAYQTFTTQPYGPGSGSYIGWIYFGNRTGNANVVQYPSGLPYVLPKRLRDKPTSKVLATCWHYLPGNNPWGGYLPHYGPSETMGYVPIGTFPGAPVLNDFKGINVFYLDGSAKWNRFSGMSILKDVDYIYYDPD